MKKTRFLQHDHTEKVYTSPRQEGTYLYVTSHGDDIINNVVGSGNYLHLDNSVDKNNTKIIEIQFLENVFLKDGYVFWENAVSGDNASLEFVLPANTVFPSEQSSGNVNIVDGIPTSVTASQTPDETWTGSHFYFPMDVVLFRFINRFMLIGSNTHGLVITSDDTAELQKELKIRLTLYTPTNSDICVSVSLKTYREHTI